MLTIAPGKEGQWRRFHLAHDIPPEFSGYADELAEYVERRLKTGHGFGVAMEAALKNVDDTAARQFERFSREAVMNVLLDYWQYSKALRTWLNNQANAALDDLPVPVPKGRRGPLWG